MLCFLALCFSVFQQNPLVIPDIDRAVGQYMLAPSIVFLAHSDKAGEQFVQLSYGDEITYEGKTYTVNEVIFMQALEPENTRGDLIDLESGKRYTAGEVIKRVYFSGGMTLQTCVTRDGNPLWGRVFIRANKE
jgi:hypothetical protein